MLLLESDCRTSVSLTDIVYVGVLHTEHWRVGLLLLEAGKNVLCEKPFAMNSRQVKELVAAAKKNNVFLMEVELSGQTFYVHKRATPRWRGGLAWVGDGGLGRRGGATKAAGSNKVLENEKREYECEGSVSIKMQIRDDDKPFAAPQLTQCPCAVLHSPL